MTVRTFYGKAYIAPKFVTATKGFATAATYGSGKWSTDGVADFITGISSTVNVLPIKNGMTIEEKAVSDFKNGLTDKKNTLMEVTGKFEIELDVRFYNLLKRTFQQVESEIRVADADNNQGVQCFNVIPYFAETTKFGDMQKAEVTFVFRQAANIANGLKRLRILDLTAF